MKTTRYTNTSRKVVAVALALVMLATMFVGCNNSKNEDTTTTTTTTEVQTSIEVVTEIVTDEEGEAVTDDNGEVLTTEVTKVVEVTSQSDEETSSDKSNSTTSTTNSSTTTTKQTETTTKKNTSSGSSNKVTTTNKNSSTCSHSWSSYEWNDGEYWRTCSKCGDIESWVECNHTYGSWNYRSWQVRYKTCTKCGWEIVEEGDYKDYCMGTKSEYLELLGYINEARREAGLNELVYLDELQDGADVRAKELTIKYSHTRPNGENYSSVYKEYKWTYLKGYRFDGCGENIVANPDTAEQAFGAWMNSEGHRKTILDGNAFGFVASRCDDKWMMLTVITLEN